MEQQAGSAGVGGAGQAESRPLAPSRAPVCERGDDDVVVVGVAARLPGLDNVAEVWQALCDGSDIVGEGRFPKRRATDIANVLRRQGSAVDKTKPFLFGSYFERVDEFDNHLFGIDEQTALNLSPEQRLFLEVTWQLLADCGMQTSVVGSDTAVFVGNSINKYKGLLPEPRMPSSSHGNHAPFIGGRVSFQFDLHGPGMMVATGCSSSLLAVHLAAQALRAGECTAAVAGGVTLDLLPLNTPNHIWNQLGITGDGVKCKPFDDGANGIAKGEGAAAVMLKLRKHAVRDGNHIYGTLLATAANHDGRSSGITAPNPVAQAQLYKRAWDACGIHPSELGYIEAHGTGTRKGDPIELAGLRDAWLAFEDDHVLGRMAGNCKIGSCKSNFGHTADGVAGVLGLIKVLLSLEHNLIPASLHVDTLNKSIDWAHLPFTVCREKQAYPKTSRTGLRLAAVSAFGLLGTNVHAVVEAEPVAPPESALRDSRSCHHLITLRGATEAALRQEAEMFAASIESGSIQEWQLNSFCFSINAGRSATAAGVTRKSYFRYRAVARGQNLHQLASALRGVAPSLVVPKRQARNCPKPLSFDGASRAYMNGEAVDWPALYSDTRMLPLLPPPLFALRQRFWPRSIGNDISPTIATAVAERSRVGGTYVRPQPRARSPNIVRQRLCWFLEHKCGLGAGKVKWEHEHSTELVRLGVDSLLSTAVGTFCRQEFGVQIEAPAMFGLNASLDELVRLVTSAASLETDESENGGIEADRNDYSSRTVSPHDIGRIGAEFPLLDSQLPVYAAHLVNPTAYNTSNGLLIRGPLRVPEFEKAVNHVLAKHVAFRLIFETSPNRLPVQRMLEAPPRLQIIQQVPRTAPKTSVPSALPIPAAFRKMVADADTRLFFGGHGVQIGDAPASLPATAQFVRDADMVVKSEITRSYTAFRVAEGVDGTNSIGKMAHEMPQLFLWQMVGYMELLHRVNMRHEQFMLATRPPIGFSQGAATVHVLNRAERHEQLVPLSLHMLRILVHMGHSVDRYTRTFADYRNDSWMLQVRGANGADVDAATSSVEGGRGIAIAVVTPDTLTLCGHPASLAAVRTAMQMPSSPTSGCRFTSLSITAPFHSAMLKPAAREAVTGIMGMAVASARELFPSSEQMLPSFVDSILCQQLDFSATMSGVPAGTVFLDMGPIDTERTSTATSLLPSYWVVQDISKLDDGNWKNGVNALCHDLLKDLAQTPMDLANSAPVKCVLWPMTDGRYFFGSAVHHVVFDGTSHFLFFKELWDAYDHFCGAPKAALSPHMDASLVKCALRNGAISAAVRSSRQYWIRECKGLQPVTIPGDKPRPKVFTFKGSKAVRLLPRKLIDGLRAVAAGSGVTLFECLATCVVILVHLFSGEDDLAIGTPVASRGVDEQSTIGCFAKSFPLRVKFSSASTFGDVLAELAARSRECQGNTHFPSEFDQSVKSTTDPGITSPQYGVEVVLHNETGSRESGAQARGSAAHNELGLERLTARDETCKWDLYFDFVLEAASEHSANETCVLRVEYYADLYSRPFVALILDTFERVLSCAASQPLQTPVCRMLAKEKQPNAARSSSTPAASIQDHDRGMSITKLLFPAGVGGYEAALSKQLESLESAASHIAVFAGAGSTAWVAAVRACLRHGRTFVLMSPKTSISQLSSQVRFSQIGALITDPASVHTCTRLAWSRGTKPLVVFCVGPESEDFVEPSNAQTYSALWDHLSTKAAEDDDADVGGWYSAFDATRVMADAEIDAFVANTVEKLAPHLRGAAVLEVGVATCLTMQAVLANFSVESYVGTDISARMIERAQNLANKNGWHNARFHVGVDLPATIPADAQYDVIILNSVVQYFPGPAYTHRVLVTLAKRLCPGGILWVGDVPNLLTKYELLDQLRRHRRCCPARRVRVSLDDDLFLPPAFFDNVAATCPGIRSVSISKKLFEHQSELGWRYDVKFVATNDAASTQDTGNLATATAPWFRVVRRDDAVTLPPVHTASYTGRPATCLRPRCSDRLHGVVDCQWAAVSAERLAQAACWYRHLLRHDATAKVAIDPGLAPAEHGVAIALATWEVGGTVLSLDDKRSPEATVAVLAPETVRLCGAEFTQRPKWQHIVISYVAFNPLLLNAWHVICPLASITVLLVTEHASRPLAAHRIDASHFPLADGSPLTFNCPEHSVQIEGVHGAVGKVVDASTGVQTSLYGRQLCHGGIEIFPHLEQQPLFVEAALRIPGVEVGRATTVGGIRTLIVGVDDVEVQVAANYADKAQATLAAKTADSMLTELIVEQLTCTSAELVVAFQLWTSRLLHSDQFILKTDSGTAEHRVSLNPADTILSLVVQCQYSALAKVSTFSAPEAELQLIHGQYVLRCALSNFQTAPTMATSFSNVLSHVLNCTKLTCVSDVGLTGALTERPCGAKTMKTEIPDSEALASVFSRILRSLQEIPNEIGVSDSFGSSLTNMALMQSSAAVAALLCKNGVRHGQTVALLLRRSCKLLVAMLACLQVGAAFVHLDDAYPTEMIEWMAKDCEAEAVLFDDAHRSRALNISVATLLNIGHARDDQVLSEGYVYECSPQDICFLVYSSGSTGQPKAAEVYHCSVQNVFSTIGEMAQLSPGKRGLAVSAACFDISAVELLCPLQFGMHVHICSEAEQVDPDLLWSRITEYSPHFLQATPTMFKMLLSSHWVVGTHKIDAVIAAGEPLDAVTASALLERSVRLWNGYGPSECTLFTTFHHVQNTKSQDNIAIGSFLPRVTGVVRDQHGQPLPLGVAGELWVGGAAVSRGYRNRAELTRQRFVGHEYRTGDVVVVSAISCDLHFLGRNDSQVKVHGRRIEVGQIEAALQSIDGVKQAAVGVRADSLVAFVVTGSDVGGVIPTTQKLRETLAAKLPKFMVPSAIERIPSIPTTKTFKVDRLALLAASTTMTRTTHDALLVGAAQHVRTILGDALPAAAMPDRIVALAVASDSTKDLLASRNGADIVARKLRLGDLPEAARALAIESSTGCSHGHSNNDGASGKQRRKVWDVLSGSVMKVLGLNTQPSKDDNFFELGGHSIAIVSLMLSLRGQGLTVSVTDVMATPILGILSEAIAQNSVDSDGLDAGQTLGATGTGSGLGADDSGTLNNGSPAAQDFFALNPLFPNQYVFPCALRSSGRLDESAVRQGLSVAIERHDGLRLSFQRHDENAAGVTMRPVQFGDAVERLSVRTVELDGVAPGHVWDLLNSSSIVRDSLKQITESLDLKTGRLVGATIVWHGDRTTVFVVVHHLAVDVSAWWILAQELQMLWKGQAPSPVPRLPSAMATYHCFPALTKTIRAAISSGCTYNTAKFVRVSTSARVSGRSVAAMCMLALAQVTSGLSLGGTFDPLFGLADMSLRQKLPPKHQLSVVNASLRVPVQLSKNSDVESIDALLKDYLHNKHIWAEVDLEASSRKPMWLVSDLSALDTRRSDVVQWPIVMVHELQHGRFYRPVTEARLAPLELFIWAENGVLSLGLLFDTEVVHDGLGLLTAIRDCTFSALGDGSSESAKPASARGSAAEPVATAVLESLWKQLLHVDSVAPDSDFFDHGGHSLLAKILQSKMREQGLRIEAAVFLQARKFGAVAAAVSRIPLQEPSSQMVEESIHAMHSPLRACQNQLVLADSLNPDGVGYVETISVVLAQPNEQHIRRVVRGLCSMHPFLNMVVAMTSAGLMLQPKTKESIAIPLIFHDCSFTDMREAISVAKACIRPINVKTGLAYAVGITDSCRSRGLLCISLHHLLVDAFSLQCLQSDLEALVVQQRPVQITPPPLRDFFSSMVEAHYAELAFLESEDATKARQHWVHRYEDVLSPLNLCNWAGAADHPDTRGTAGCTCATVPAHVRHELRRQFSPGQLFAVFLGSYLLTLHRLSGSTDIVVPMPISSRHTLPHRSDQMGMFLATLPCRFCLQPFLDQPRASFASFVDKVASTVFEDTESQLPFDQIVAAIRASGHVAPLIDNMFNYEVRPRPRSGLPRHLFVIAAKTPLSVDFIETGGVLQIVVEYDQSLFAPSFVDAVIGLTQDCLGRAAAQPNITFRDAIPGAWAHGVATELMATTTTRTGKSKAPTRIRMGAPRCSGNLCTRIRAHCMGNPHLPAVSFNDTLIRRDELWATVTQLATGLQALEHFRQNPAVVLVLSRTPNIVILPLAVWVAGGSFTPLVAGTLEMLGEIVAQCNTKVVVTDSEAPLPIPAPSSVQIVAVAELMKLAAPRLQQQANDGLYSRSITKDSVAYTIFTSGSTGKPKACSITHANANCMASSWQAEYALTNRDTMLQWAPFSFDVCMGDILRSQVACAGHLVICPAKSRIDVRAVASLVRRYSVSVMEVTPGFASELVKWESEQLACLRILVCGSDVLHTHTFNSIRLALPESTRVLNSYGMSEATVDSTFYEANNFLPIHTASGTVPIGRAMQNVVLKLVDPRNLAQTVGQFAAGELCIRDDTAGRSNGEFVGRFMRTGDLVRVNHAGNIEFIGRADGIRKVRGFRVNTGFVEDQITTVCSEVHKAVVSVEGDSLVVFIETEDTTLSAIDLQKRLRNVVPSYMYPTFVYPMKRIPLTAHGKVSRRLLPPFSEVQRVAAAHPTASTEHIPAHTNDSSKDGYSGDQLQLLVKLWSECIQLPSTTNLDVENTPLLSVGSSLQLMLFHNKLIRTVPGASDVDIVDMFEISTLRRLAQRLNRPSQLREPVGTQQRAHVDINARVDPLSQSDVAIVGVGLRLPGSIASIADLRTVLSDSSCMHDFVSAFPAERAADVQKGADGQPPPLFDGAFLENVADFDNAFFGLASHEKVVNMAPEQRLVLQVVAEAFNDCGLLHYCTADMPLAVRGAETCGVFIAQSNISYGSVLPKDSPSSVPGLDPAFVQTHVASVFNLRGSSLVVNQTCASGLAALKAACESLRRGECNSAVVAGANIHCIPMHDREYEGMGVLSRDGHCRPFTDGSDGTILGEGVIALVLRRGEDVRSDGFGVYGTVAGIASCSVGRGASITAPSKSSQVTAMQRALAQAARNPEDVSYIEAHGTGTSLGDRIELQALHEVYGQSSPGASPVYIGSSKARFGHLDSVSGLLGVVKTLAVLQNNEIPPLVNMTSPHSWFQSTSSRLRLSASKLIWSQQFEPRIAGVSSLGLNGTAVHAVLAASRKNANKHATTNMHVEVLCPLIVSAPSQHRLLGALRSLVKRLRTVGCDDVCTFRDVCYTTSVVTLHRTEAVIAVLAKNLRSLQRMLDTLPQSDTMLDTWLRRLSTTASRLPGLGSVHSDEDLAEFVRVAGSVPQERLAVLRRWLAKTQHVGDNTSLPLKHCVSVPQCLFNPKRFWPGVSTLRLTASATPLGPYDLATAFQEQHRMVRGLVHSLNLRPAPDFGSRQLEFVNGIIRRFFATDMGVREFIGTELELLGCLGLQSKYGKLLHIMCASLVEGGEATRPGVTHATSSTVTSPTISFVVDDPPTRSQLQSQCAELAARYPGFEDQFRFPLTVSEQYKNVLANPPKTSPLTVLYPEGRLFFVEEEFTKLGDLLGNVYYGMYCSFICSHVHELVKRNPSRRVRILECGAGMGLVTRELLPKLADLGDKNIEYIFTDLGKAFVENARDQFSATYSFMTFSVMDITKNAASQGILGELDVIISYNVIHTTQSIELSVENLQHTLCPGGTLFIIESCRNETWATLAWGILDGWWYFSDYELRPHNPMLEPEKWEALLAARGFESVVVCPTHPEEREFVEKFMFACTTSVTRNTIKSSGSSSSSNGKRNSIILRKPIHREWWEAGSTFKVQAASADMHAALQCEPIDTQHLDAQLELRVRQAIVSIWTHLLHWDETDDGPIPTTIGFHELGGESLLDVRMLAMIKQATGQALEIVDLYSRTSIDSLVAFIASKIHCNSNTTAPATTMLPADIAPRTVVVMFPGQGVQEDIRHSNRRLMQVAAQKLSCDPDLIKFVTTTEIQVFTFVDSVLAFFDRYVYGECKKSELCVDGTGDGSATTIDGSSVVFGLSLGEMSAVVASGALSVEDGLDLVIERGACLQRVEPGAMLAVRGVDCATLEATLRDHCRGVSIANHLTRLTFVVAGTLTAVKEARRVLENQGAGCRLLPVHAAFHTPAVAEAAAEYGQAVRRASALFQPNKIGLVLNTANEARYFPPGSDPADIVTTLASFNVAAPCHFSSMVECAKRHVAVACTVFDECGPGKTLTKLFARWQEEDDDSESERSIATVRNLSSLSSIVC